jgi:hypothetical protein
VVVDARSTMDLDDDGLPRPVRVRLEVTRLDGRRTDRIALTPLPPAASEEESR